MFKIVKQKIENINREWSNKKLYITKDSKIIGDTLQTETELIPISYNIKRFNSL